MVDPFERIRDELMAKFSSQPAHAPEAIDVVLQTMVTLEGLVITPTTTRQSPRTSKGPTPGVRLQEKRKRGTFEEEYLSFSELAAKKKTTQKFLKSLQ